MPEKRAFVAAVLQPQCQITFCGTVGAQLVGDQYPGHAILLHQLAHEALGSFRISAALHKNVEGVAMLIYGAPQPVLHHLIQMPFVANGRPIPSDR